MEIKKKVPVTAKRALKYLISSTIAFKPMNPQMENTNNGKNISLVSFI